MSKLVILILGRVAEMFSFSNGKGAAADISAGATGFALLVLEWVGILAKELPSWPFIVFILSISFYFVARGYARFRGDGKVEVTHKKKNKR